MSEVKRPAKLSRDLLTYDERKRVAPSLFPYVEGLEAYADACEQRLQTIEADWTQAQLKVEAIYRQERDELKKQLEEASMAGDIFKNSWEQAKSELAAQAAAANGLREAIGIVVKALEADAKFLRHEVAIDACNRYAAILNAALTAQPTAAMERVKALEDVAEAVKNYAVEVLDTDQDGQIKTYAVLREKMAALAKLSAADEKGRG